MGGAGPEKYRRNVPGTVIGSVNTAAGVEIKVK